jgi:hypothetical protein
MQKEYEIQISCNNEDAADGEEYTYMVCVYDKSGDGLPVIEHHEELDISDTSLELLLCDDLDELGISIADCEILHDY